MKCVLLALAITLEWETQEGICNFIQFLTPFFSEWGRFLPRCRDCFAVFLLAVAGEQVRGTSPGAAGTQAGECSHR